ncbi:hypothetical protein LSH36_317g01045 [Paralvinella palmiformis]|uniref:Prolyl 4-hydroxylase alpha subunit domain-containing protein n=1 Tax=Paralvinella palmiformis TaxID=53620 RepID=A0AAD9JHL5_9ANNE|nr:hypothetical protein LSH36_317g01045 [Paralvinella palmiformis]
MTQCSGSFNKSAFEKGLLLPTAVDFDGAIESLVRLQKTYDIPVGDLATGLIDGMQALRRLEIMDWYRIGRRLAEVDQAMAVDWFEAVLSAGAIVQGLYVATLLEEKDLICIYKRGVLPYVVYKEELHSFSPRISIYHDVVSDRTAQELINISLERLSAAQVGSPTNPQVTNIRVSKVAWLEDDRNAKITRQISDMTGLATDFIPYRTNAEYLQHRSALEQLPPFMQNAGDRLATFMIYNGAAFWYNFDLAGERGDPRTLHGACPVLFGQKWVANKWIRQYGQIFRKPCALTKDADYPIF